MIRYIVRNIRLSDKEKIQNLLSSSFLLNHPRDSKNFFSWIQKSEESFQKKIDKEDRHFIFVLEDLQTKQLIACSQILSAYKTRNQPYFLLQDFENQKALKLCYDTKGKHQVGGLFLHPSYRKTKDRLGFLITRARYLYISNFSDQFSRQIEANLTGPFYKKDGILHNDFWNEVGKKYHSISYQDSLLKLFQNPVDFYKILPKDLTIPFKSLSQKAQSCIESIHYETQPAYKNLLKIGFQYKKKHHFIDGAKYLSVFQEKLSILKQAQKLFVKEKSFLSSPKIYLCAQTKGFDFFATLLEAEVYEDKLCLQKGLSFLDKDLPVSALPLN